MRTSILLVALMLSLVLLSCKKEKKCNCGKVMDKVLIYNTNGISHSIGFYDPCTETIIGVFVPEDLYNSLEIGDIYCIP
jgi:hypothetical protein